MSAFGIWAIVLTGVYLFYYAGMICFDLFVRKQGVKKEGVEEFNTSGDLSDDEDDSSVAVHELRSGGHAFGDTPDEEEEPAAVVTPPAASDGGETQDPLQQEQARQEQDMVDRMRDAQLNPVPVSFQEEYDSAEYNIVMSNPKTSNTRIFRQIVNDTM